MYRCNSCEENVVNINGQCFCGKTTTDHKGRVTGENFSKIQEEGFSERPKLMTCPHCGWKGMVIPRFNIGCPEHKLWYKNVEEKHIIAGEDDESKPADNGYDPGGSPRADRREEGRHRKERQILRRPNRKRQQCLP